MFAFFDLHIPWFVWLPYMLVMLALSALVVRENRNPVRSLAWVAVLLCLPVVGLLLYLVFGRSLRNTRMISRRDRRKLKRESTRPPRLESLGLSPESERLIHLSRKLTDASYHAGGDVQIFTDGASKFAALKRDLAAAKSYILLQYYIISDDTTGREVRQILIDRAKAGVKVKVVYDDVGCFGVSSDFFQGMREAGVEAHPFFKVTFPDLASKVNWRNHRKICIIDGTTGYIGGMNIADRYIDGGTEFDVWRDTHLRITGSAVSALQYSFTVDWNFIGLPIIEERPDPAVEPQEAKAKDAAEPPIVMQLMSSGPTSQWPNVAFLFQQAIASAKKRVYIQTPYFLPTESLLRCLQTAALSGIDVRVMIPRRADSKMLTVASASYIAECLQAGIKIYFYDAGMLHAKMVIVDDEFVSIGSTNFDFRSFEHNFESNMQIYSRAVNAQAAEIFQADLAHSSRVDAERWRRRPAKMKFTQSLLRLLSPIL